MTFSPAIVKPEKNHGSFRRTLRSLLSDIFADRHPAGSSKMPEAWIMDLYHADSDTLRELGLTRMDVIRMLETRPRS